MIYNPVYDARYQKVMDCIAFKNEHVLSTQMGQAVAPSFDDTITLAEYMDDHEKGMKAFLRLVEKLNERAPIDCINFAYPGGHKAALTLAWWSKIDMPGHELPENSVWQVEECERMTRDDYDTIIAEGSSASVQQRIIKDIVTKEELDAFFDYYVVNNDKYSMQYVDAGYPVLNSGIACPPFETLCGGRSMSKFFMDCYKMIDKVKAVEEIMFEELKQQLDSLPNPKPPYLIGRWIGGWRGASNMVNQKIWDELVWPYMKGAAEILIEKGITPIFHLDACWNRDLERFLEMPEKTCIINTDGMTDLRLARKILGDHTALMGDVPSQMLTVCSKEEIKDYTRRLIDDIGPQGLFIAAGCDAPSSSQFENLVAIHEVAQEF